jgi:hypothetical protein
VNNKELVFESIELQSCPAKLGAGEYLVMEASGRAMDAYRKAQFGESTLEDGKPVIRASGLVDADAVLLSHCLVRRDNGKPADRKFIDGLPHHIREALVDKCKELSAIANDEKEQDEVEERLGNLPSGTDTGST